MLINVRLVKTRKRTQQRKEGRGKKRQRDRGSGENQKAKKADTKRGAERNKEDKPDGFIEGDRDDEINVAEEELSKKG